MSAKRTSIRSGIALIATGAVVAMAAISFGGQYVNAPWGSKLSMLASSEAALECPPGYRATDPIHYAEEFHGELTPKLRSMITERYGNEVCATRRKPESMMEVGEWISAPTEAASAPYSSVPAGAFRAAVEQKKALLKQQKSVPNAAGSWQDYGSGPQVSLEEFTEGFGDGIPSVAGRVDDLVYDEDNMRLFASVGTGGVWMSQATGGDLSTLGDSWTSIGDNLPTLVNSSLTWSEAVEGGRLIVLTGEHVQGGNTYVGLGAYYSDDLGQTWTNSVGLPDGVGASQIVVDPSNEAIVYAGTHGGLFRSDDAGATFTNVALPVSEQCAGSVDFSGPCQLANVVSDVVVQMPGGSTDVVCEAAGCPVLAAVGYRSGDLPYADGVPQSPGNGFYRSSTGTPGTFARVGGSFIDQAQIGRIEMGPAVGSDQDHNVVYAIVQDAALLNGTAAPYLDSLNIGLPNLQDLPCDDLPEGDPQFICELLAAGIAATYLNGIYVSLDFGESWTLMADETELQLSAVNGSSLVATAALGVGPGIQSWYDLWIAPDPTATDPLLGVPTRLAFGMEEVWKNELSSVPVPLDGTVQSLNVLDFSVFGTYFAGETCLFLIGNIGPGVPVCPTYDGIVSGTTTHPDQHVGLFIPDEVNGGVWLFAGNDGGVYKQYSADPLTDDFSNNDWGDGSNQGFYTLMNYGIAVANDGTVVYGLQDNASGFIDPETRQQIRTYVGDGVWVEVDPSNSDVMFVQTPGLAINRSTDGGRTFASASPGEAEVGNAHFLGPFTMDPQNSDHMIASGTMVAETLNAVSAASSPDPTGTGILVDIAEVEWVPVFDLGLNPDDGVTPFQTRHRPIDVEGSAAYVGYCGPCSVLDGNAQFKSGLATNVGGELPPQSGTSDGWHHATAQGLPNRFIYGVEIDPADPNIVYVVLGGYSTSRWLSPGGYLDENTDVGTGHVYKSTDAGESFVDISGDLPDTNVISVIKRRNQLIVGTDIGAFISSDLQGSNWAPLGDLPNVPINQVELQANDDNLLFAGTFGRGVQLFDFAEASDFDDATGGNDGADVPTDAPSSVTRGGAIAPLGVLIMLFYGVALTRRRYALP